MNTIPLSRSFCCTLVSPLTRTNSHAGLQPSQGISSSSHGSALERKRNWANWEFPSQRPLPPWCHGSGQPKEKKGNDRTEAVALLLQRFEEDHSRPRPDGLLILKHLVSTPSILTNEEYRTFLESLPIHESALWFLASSGGSGAEVDTFQEIGPSTLISAFLAAPPSTGPAGWAILSLPVFFFAIQILT